MSEVAPQLNLDVGLVQVTFQHEPDAPPSMRALEAPGPNNPHFQLQLEEVLYMPASQEQQLLAALQPRINNLDILQPWKFNAMIGQVLKWFEDQNAQNAINQKDRETFQRAEQTLKKFNELAGTLRRFLHALHRG
jgi:hypothetical protein